MLMPAPIFPNQKTAFAYQKANKFFGARHVSKSYIAQACKLASKPEDLFDDPTGNLPSSVQDDVSVLRYYFEVREKTINRHAASKARLAYFYPSPGVP
jgi:hypothetical protein